MMLINRIEKNIYILIVAYLGGCATLIIKIA